MPNVTEDKPPTEFNFCLISKRKIFPKDAFHLFHEATVVLGFFCDLLGVILVGHTLLERFINVPGFFHL